MKRAIDALISAGLLLSLFAALCQLTLMLLDILLPAIRWYWGGSLAFFAAPVAFALTRRLLAGSKLQDVSNA